MRALVHGFAIAGASTARALLARGHDVVATDDVLDEAKVASAAALGLELRRPPDELDAHVAGFDVVVPAPGVPETHGLVAAARRVGVELATEIELAHRWELERPGGPRPVLGVTGTDGKTTTTELAVAMLDAAGHRAVAAGNTDVPMVDAIDLDVDVLVVECTSFRLAWTTRFRCDAAAWLNLAPDHLNWHASMATYEAAKARIFQLQQPDDVAVGNLADPVVARHLAAAPGRRVGFALDDPAADYRLDGDHLVGPAGPLVARSAMWRGLPHDVVDALAAAALVVETGLADADAVAAGAAAFATPPHRIELVAERDGVRWFDDSKATTPHAAATAIAGFDRVVLVAGGRNKGLDLAPMAAEAQRLRGVVAIGEAADEVGTLFGPHAPVRRAADMDAAVLAAAELASPGDVVLLSPGCASFDWYPTGGYAARGDDFRRAVLRHLGAGGDSDASDASSPRPPTDRAGRPS